MTEPRTNTELVQDFMEYSRNGALSQLFVIEALGRFAEQCALLTDEEIEKMESFFNMYRWRDTAKEWIELSEKFYKHQEGGL